MKHRSTPNRPVADLSTLATVSLNARHAAMLERSLAGCRGTDPWCFRKRADATDVFRLAEISGRLHILGLDLAGDLRLELLMRVPVPLLPSLQGPLEVADTAHLGIIYRQEALLLPQPGYSFVHLLGSRPVFHPNVAAGPGAVRALCLGPQLASGIPLRELILLTYGALTMVSVQLDPANFAGLLNPAAADFFQRNLSLLPLSREPFLSPGGAGQ